MYRVVSLQSTLCTGTLGCLEMGESGLCHVTYVKFHQFAIWGSAAPRSECEQFLSPLKIIATHKIHNNLSDCKFVRNLFGIVYEKQDTLRHMQCDL